MLYVAWKKRGPPQKFAHLSGFVQLKSVLFNLSCVLDLFFRTPSVNSVSDLCSSYLHGQVIQTAEAWSLVSMYCSLSHGGILAVFMQVLVCLYGSMQGADQWELTENEERLIKVFKDARDNERMNISLG